MDGECDLGEESESKRHPYNVSSTQETSLVLERLDFAVGDTPDQHHPHDIKNEEETEDYLLEEPSRKRRRHSESNVDNGFDISADDKQIDEFDGYQESEDKLDRYGTHEFEIIDEVLDDEDGKGDENDQDSDDSFDDSELYALLEEGITKDSISGIEKPTEREKFVLVERGHDPFDILPEGWIVVTHNSGMPVYLHRESRVCTMAQPYFLGSGSARKHDIPISAIPCLKYRQELEKEKAAFTNANTFSVSENGHDQLGNDLQNTSSAKQEAPETDAVGTDDASVSTAKSDANFSLTSHFPAVKIKSAEEVRKETSLDYLKVRDYCQKLFEFKTVTVQRYKTWKDRRKHLESKKYSRPELPSSTKLITCSLPITAAPKEKKRNKGKGKSDFCPLTTPHHEDREKQPYGFENAMTNINGISLAY